jgi:hypothetical protein
MGNDEPQLKIKLINAICPVEGEWCIYENVKTEFEQYNELKIYIPNAIKHEETTQLQPLFLYHSEGRASIQVA